MGTLAGDVHARLQAGEIAARNPGAGAAAGSCFHPVNTTATAGCG